MKDHSITDDQLALWRDAYRSDPQRLLATQALSRVDLSDVAFCAAGANKLRYKFSLELETLPVTNQMSSGRCWLFAAANVLRERVAKEKNLKNFEFSQSWLAFWDKFERANYFMECILNTASLPTDDRVVQHILTTGVHDGGQWDMFVNIVEKYGLVPKDVYDEPYQVCHSRNMNAVLNQSLKTEAAKLRALKQNGASEEAIDAEKNDCLRRIFGFLCSCYGEPPKSFDLELVDKNGVYSIEKNITPMQLYERYAKDLLQKTVCIINAPTQDKPFDRTFTVQLLGNVVGAKGVKYLNLDMPAFKQAVIDQLKDGKVVWFGSDVGKYGYRDLGIWDDQSFGYDLLTGLDTEISKENALNYWFSAMNHAMVITGVNLENGKPTRWKIENSWGDAKGDKGYYVCSDSWFDRFVYQAAVEKVYLGNKAALFAQEPIELQPWDPMGTLAD